MSDDILQVEREGAVQVVTLNRPDRLNALNQPLTDALLAYFEARRRDTDCRVILIRGAGRGFCSGADLKAAGQPDRLRDGPDGDWVLRDLMKAMRACPQPIVALVHGAAAGGGLAIALASDVIVAAESAAFHSAFIKIGLSASELGVSWRLQRTIGISAAREMLLTGRPMRAADALRTGLVSQVVPDNELLACGRTLAEEMLGAAPDALRISKHYARQRAGDRRLRHGARVRGARPDSDDPAGRRGAGAAGRTQLSAPAMSLTFDLYWSFRSPYSYLATPRLLDLVTRCDVTCNVRPVYPLAVRTPEFFDTRDPLWGPYLMRDIRREAEFLGLPIRWPRPDPVQQSAEAGYRMQQPYIHRLTHLGVAAAERGRGLPFLREVSHVIWSGEVNDWHQGDHLAGAAARAGLDWAELSAAVDADPARYAEIVAASQTDQRAAGHWGVPMMVFGGEPFFGQDRIDQLVWRLRQAGMTDR